MSGFKELIEERKEQMLEKYPYMDESRFEYTIGADKKSVYVWFIKDDGYRIRITDPEFINNKEEWIYLHNSKEKKIIWPKIFTLSKDNKIEKLSQGRFHHEWHGKYDLGQVSGFPEEKILNYPTNNFRIYVSDSSYFMSKLPLIEDLIPDNDNFAKSWSDSQGYYRVLFSTYCATFSCGVSIQHLTPSDKVYPMITSIMRWHVYFTIRRLVRRMESGEKMKDISREFNAQYLYDHLSKIPKHNKKVLIKVKNPYSGHIIDTHGYKERLLPGYHTDYKRYIPKKSYGFTKIGIQSINQSIEAFIYSVLGAQSRTRQSIVGPKASALETQEVFRKLAKDSIVNYSVSTWILNMNKAITDTNVIQNLAISPKLWLIPSNMIILKKKIVGYNNLLKVASEGMNFGVNNSVNKIVPKLPSLKPIKKNDFSPIDNKKSTNIKDKNKESTITEKKSDNTTILPIYFLLAIIPGYLVSKYVF